MRVLRTVFRARRATLAAAIVVLSVALVACGSDPSEPAAQAAPTEAPQPTEVPQSPPPAAPRPTEVPQLPQAAPAPEAENPGVTLAMASTDLAVGDNRVAFGVIDTVKGAIKGAPVQVQTFFLTDAGPQGPVQTADAPFVEWPGGFGGVYVARLSFGQPGNWLIGAVVQQPDGSTVRVGTVAQVAQQSRTPPIGSPAPASNNKTARDVTNLEELTTDTSPDPELYAMTIAEALEEDMPLLVTFATPAYCTSSACGPQMDIVKELKAKHGDRMNFIHIEVFENPPEIRQGGIEQGRISPILAEWSLATEPWTFVMDRQGLVRLKFEGFVSTSELEDAIDQVLE